MPYLVDPLDERLAAVVPPGSLYAVGGRVRDEVRAELGQCDAAFKDLDYVVTGVPLHDLRERLETLGSVDVVGASFSVLKVTVDGRTADVALPRRERSTGAHHRAFEVHSGPDVTLDDDLARRDFRMNMLARALPSGTLVDPYHGAADIAARRIDVLTESVFEEDPLRMLRAAQFAARFGYVLSARAREAMTAVAKSIGNVSAERISDELTKLLARAPRPSIGLEILRETGVLGELWPELLEGYGVEQNAFHAYDVYRHSLETLDATPPGDLILRLAALLHDVGKPRTKEGPHFYRHEHVGEELARAMLVRFRFPNEVVDATAHLVRGHMYRADSELTDAALRRFVRRVGAGELNRQFALRAADIVGSGKPKWDDSNERFEARVWAEVARKPPFSIKDLAIDGDTVVDAMVQKGIVTPGFRGDARVGAALQWLFEQVTDEPKRNERNSLLTLLSDYLDCVSGQS
ncbi:MAG: HD domain-containing protein [Candidatus Eremiobacteraeota bacterium]|nr:HD domain-containing protein [Candidatus Eremiobacteraeota bacterium]